MPPRSVCLNVFTSSLGDAGAAVRDDGSFNSGMPGVMERRDSAQSGMLILSFLSLYLLLFLLAAYSHEPRYPSQILIRLHRISAHTECNIANPSRQSR